MKHDKSSKKTVKKSSLVTGPDLEEVLRQSEASYHDLFNTIRQAIYIQDHEGRFVEVNDGACAMYGYTREEFIGRTPEFLSAPGLNDFEFVTEKIRQAFAGEPQQFEFWGKRKEGEIFPKDVRIYKGTYFGKDVLITIADDITERKAAAEALNSKNVLLNALINSSSDLIIFSLDRNYRYTSFNKKHKDEMLKVWEADIQLGMNLLDCMTNPVLRNIAKKSIDLALQGEALTEVQFQPEVDIWYEFSWNPIRQNHGKITGVTVFVRDITERKQKESALKESEERYSALFSNNNSVSLIIDPDTGRIVNANDAAARYYGYSRDQLLALGIHDLNRLAPEKVVRNLMRAKDKKEKHFFSTHYRADGEKRYVEIYSGPITVQGKPLFYSIIHDVTDSRLAALALKESEERYRTLVDQLPDYVLVHRDGILLYVNPAAASNLGYDVEKLIGNPIFPLIAPEYHKTVRQAIIRRMAGEFIPSYEMKILAGDGTFRTVLTNGAAITFEGKPASLNVLTDISTLKEAEETIRSANEVLEKRVTERTEALSKTNEQLTAEVAARALAEEEITRSLEEKDLLLREIHHRVKNNLQIIASLLNLQSRYITDPNVLESIKESQSRVRAMALVHERIYRSHNIAEINLKDYLKYLTKQILQFYNIQHHQIGISVTMDEILADIDTVIPVGLILNELVSNSLKHAFSDGRKGTISIEGTPQDANSLRFIYHDNGVGLPAGFDWKNTESLGLRLVNSLVDQLDGTIESSSGEGTTFIITIQQKRDPAPS